MDGWNTIVSFWGPAYFQGANCYIVSGSVLILSPRKTSPPTQKKQSMSGENAWNVMVMDFWFQTILMLTNQKLIQFDLHICFLQLGCEETHQQLWVLLQLEWNFTGFARVFFFRHRLEGDFKHDGVFHLFFWWCWYTRRFVNLYKGGYHTIVIYGVITLINGLMNG